MQKNPFKTLSLLILVVTIGSHGTHYAMNRQAQTVGYTPVENIGQEVEELANLSFLRFSPCNLWLKVCVFLPIEDLQNISVISPSMNHRVNCFIEWLFGLGMGFNREVRLGRVWAGERRLALNLYLSSLDAYHDGNSTFDQALRRCLAVRSSAEEDLSSLMLLFTLEKMLGLAILFAKSRPNLQAKRLLKDQLKSIRLIISNHNWPGQDCEDELLCRATRTLNGLDPGPWAAKWNKGWTLGQNLSLGLIRNANKILRSEGLPLEHFQLAIAARAVAEMGDSVDIVKFLCEEVELSNDLQICSLVSRWQEGDLRSEFFNLWQAAENIGGEARVGILNYLLWYKVEFILEDRVGIRNLTEHESQAPDASEVYTEPETRCFCSVM